jgi:hypothetical protein
MLQLDEIYDVRLVHMGGNIWIMAGFWDSNRSRSLEVAYAAKNETI